MAMVEKFFYNLRNLLATKLLLGTLPFFHLRPIRTVRPFWRDIAAVFREGFQVSQLADLVLEVDKGSYFSSK